jgi:transmembrane sensor
MSDTGDDYISEVSDATAIEIYAADWVAARRNRKDWTEERQAELDAWLTRSLAHRVAYLRIDATWRRTDRLAALRRPMREPADGGAPRRALWMRIVAVVGLVVVTGVFVGNYITRPRAQLIETPRGGQERLTLADGSQLELNTDTAVRVDLDAHIRAVELVQGEVYFQIKHDAARPFVVTVAKHRIVDLGTKFLVRMTPQALQVALVEGSARLESASDRHPHAVVLSPGDVAVATADATHISKKSKRELSESLAWQRGSIVFHNERLADAAAEFNRYGGPQLIVADPDAAKLMINGTFLTTGAEDFAGITHEIFGLRVEHQNGNLVLSR